MRERRPLSILERDGLIQDAVQTMPGRVAERLLEALLAQSDDRAALIGRLHSDPRSRAFAELLIDLEEDRQLALDFARALKETPKASP